MAGPAAHRRETLGETLLRLREVTAEQLSEAAKRCGPGGQGLDRALVELRFATGEAVLKAEGLRSGVPTFTSLEGLLDPGTSRLLPEGVARQHLAVPLFKTDDSVVVGMTPPVSLAAMDEVSRITGLRVSPVLTTLPSLFAAIQQAYQDRPQAQVESDDASGNADPEVKTRAQSQSVIEEANTLLQESMARRASDIHLEPREHDLRVRYRVDGILQEAKAYPKATEGPLVARLKILSRLDITETRLPQDGHLRFKYGGHRVDIRVSTLPTVHGEKVVMRVLDSSKALKRLHEIGLSEPNLKSMSAAIRKPNGIILVTGPTGSGKTTTLYAALTELNSTAANIITLEDPVEYRVPGLNQVQIHSRIGLTFAAGLRSILRQDPDVILLGEIRDQETAEIAMRSALTGHLVFSTLHTNDAVSAVHRLVDMRVEPFLIAASLNGVMAQRLVRRLCDRCKREHVPGLVEVQAFGAGLEPNRPYFEARGCRACFGTGYAGRLAVHEWFSISRRTRELIVSRASPDELAAAARLDGLRALQEDALEKAREGDTSLAEVIRATREDEA